MEYVVKPDHCYRIRVRRALDASWSEWFDGLTIRNESNGDTALVGSVADQSALLGLLVKVHNLNLPLIVKQQATLRPSRLVGLAANERRRVRRDRCRLGERGIERFEPRRGRLRKR